MMSKKSQDEESFRRSLQNGNLTAKEIEELVGFEFEEKTEKLDLAGQVRRYYLKLKSADPEKAANMLAEIGNIGERVGDLRRCHVIIRKYISGTIMYFQGERIY